MFEAYTPVEVAFRLPVEISSISFQKSTQNVLAVSKRGDLLVYSRNARRSFELETCCKGFAKKAVTEMAVCDSMQTLFCLSDQQITSHDLSTSASGFPVLAILSKVKPVHTFAIYENTEDSQLYVAVSSKKRIYLFKWTSNNFVDIQMEGAQNFAENPTTLKWCGGNLAFSVKDEYFMMKMTPNGDYTVWNTEVQRLFNFMDNSIIVDMPDRMVVAFARGETFTMATYSGTKAIKYDEIRFSGILHDAVYDPPYMVSLLPKGQVEVRAVDPPQLIQTVSMVKAHLVTNGMPGFVVVGSPSDMWILDGYAGIRKNVSYLVQEKNFPLAIQLAEHSDIFTDENKVEIKRQHAYNLFLQKRFDESFKIHTEIGTEVLRVIQLFPHFLPEKVPRTSVVSDFPENDWKRATLALGDYLSLVRSELGRKLDIHASAKLAKKEEGRMDKEELETTKINLQLVDTTLLKCYLKTKPMMVDSLLRLRNNSCFFDDAEAILKKEGRLSSLFILYETKRKHRMALELLRAEARKQDPEPFFSGVDRAVGYLQTLGNQDLDLIFQYAKWILEEDMQEGLAVFTSSESELASNLDRERVAEFLRKECVAAVIPYLEHIIYKWGELRPKFHESLAEHYVAKVKTLFLDYVHAFPDDENIVRAGTEDGDLGIYRKKLLSFLETSQAYSPSTILVQLTNHAFYEERALILGRLQKHDQALTIYTSILHDYESAERYCSLYYDKENEENAEVYLQLFRAFISPSDPQIAGLNKRDLPVPAPNVQQAIRVLSRHADKINIVSALSLIPPSTPLRVLSKALNTVLQTTNDEATACAIRRSICVSALHKCENGLRQSESVRINVNSTSECTICRKKIGNSAFVRFPQNGNLVHIFCHEKSTEGGLGM